MCNEGSGSGLGAISKGNEREIRKIEGEEWEIKIQKRGKMEEKGGTTGKREERYRREEVGRRQRYKKGKIWWVRKTKGKRPREKQRKSKL